jgi:hypothetical protein
MPRTDRPVTDEEPKPGGMIAEIHQQVAGLLRGPRAVGMCSHAQDVQVAIADLEGEQDVVPPQRERAVDVEEVDREHAGGLGAQELQPGGVGMPRRRGRDPVVVQDPPDRRSADTVSELEQLAADSLMAQARVLSGHPHHQGGEDVVDRWPSNPVGVGPSSAYEAAMPAQDRVRSDQAAAAQCAGQPRDERGQ